MPTLEHVKKARHAVMLDLVRLQDAPVSEDEAGELYGQIIEAVKSLGLPEKDGLWFYRKMQRDGWRFGGIAIEDWKTLVDSFHRNNYFPSQR